MSCQALKFRVRMRRAEEPLPSWQRWEILLVCSAVRPYYSVLYEACDVLVLGCVQIVGTGVKYRVITKDSAGTVGVVDGIEPQYPFIEKGESYFNETLPLLGNERRNSKFLKWKPSNQPRSRESRKGC